LPSIKAWEKFGESNGLEKKGVVVLTWPPKGIMGTIGTLRGKQWGDKVLMD